MKTISMYELLGLINDNQAPKRIKISELIYDFDDESQMYFDEEANELSDNIYLTKNLNHPVEILNEILEEEKKIPEKLPLIANKEVNYPDDKFIERILNLFYELTDKNRLKINEIIDYFEYLKNKGDE